MNKRFRMYVGLLAAITLYYLLHEGTHLICALIIGVFKQIHISPLGIQIDVYTEQMSNLQLGIFCFLGSAATLVSGYALTVLARIVTRSKSKLFIACMYYTTITLLLLDPLYLSVLCSFVGGGDMNGIALLMPEVAARTGYGLLLAVNIFIFIRRVLPVYKSACERL